MTARPASKIYRTEGGRLISFGFEPACREFKNCIAWSDIAGKEWVSTPANDACVTDLPFDCVPDHVVIAGEDLKCFLPGGLALLLTYAGAPFTYRITVLRPEGSP